jgi:hypothetical protein
MVKTIYITTFALLLLGVFVFIMAIIARRRAVAEHEKIRRVFKEALRAVNLIESNDPREILIGLQILSAYDIPTVRLKAFPRLMLLASHGNKQVRDLAKYIIELSQKTDVTHWTPSTPSASAQRKLAVR